MRRGAWALAFVALVTLSGCGPREGAIAIPSEDVPFPLARSPQPSHPPSPATREDVYFVQGGKLVRVSRVIKEGGSDIESPVRALLAGPTPGERAAGISTLVPASVRLLQVRLVDDVAEVDLSAEFQQPGPPQEILLRVAQVVFTLDALPSVLSVRFSVEGAPISVVTDGGTAVERPVTVRDYLSVMPS